MLQKSNMFLGEVQNTRSVGGCSVALTSYNQDQSLEEWHSHPQASLSLLINGAHDEYYKGKHFKRHPGDVKFIAAGEVHRCDRYIDNSKKINLSISPELVPAFYFEQPILPTVKFGLIKLYAELEENSGYAVASAQMLLTALLHPLAPNEKHTPNWVRRLDELLHDEWNSTCDLKELSLQLGIHPVTISRYFPRYFSMTLSEYNRRLKIDRAIEMLADVNSSITQIAYECGFADHAHFTRTFKKVTGCLPKDLRRIASG